MSDQGDRFLATVDLARLRGMCAEGEPKRIRLRAKLSIGAVARAIGASTVTVMRWESGERVPKDGPLVKPYLALLDQLEDLAAARDSKQNANSPD